MACSLGNIAPFNLPHIGDNKHADMDHHHILHAKTAALPALKTVLGRHVY